jgi:hypothetical protein
MAKSRRFYNRQGFKEVAGYSADILRYTFK